MSKLVFTTNAEPYSDVINMKDLKLEKAYYIKNIEKCKFGYICETIDPDILVMDSEGCLVELTKNDKNSMGISFYANRSLSRYIKSYSIRKFILIVHEIRESVDSNGKVYKYPHYSTSVIKSGPLD